MQTEDFALVDKWIATWSCLVDLEIVPLRAPSDAVEIMASRQ